MMRIVFVSALIGAATIPFGCRRESAAPSGEAPGGGASQDAPTGSENAQQPRSSGEHSHDEVSLGTITIDDMEVSLAQGHGAVMPGKEGHLVVNLPYSDQGETVVRAWIGTANRNAYVVGKATYAASHDDYDVHATAPDPLPSDAAWWVEIEKPDGTTHVGSVRPILEK